MEACKRGKIRRNKMFRKPNTDRYGRAFSSDLPTKVFQKGALIPGYDPARWRADVCGTPMDWFEYGNTNSQYGWEIDHVLPVAHGGGDELSNLQPLQWYRNRVKGDKLNVNYCAIA